MSNVSVKCPAKINLSLDAVGKREDGYHLLRMIMQTVGLFDVITITGGQKDIKVYCENKNVPCDDRNIAYKAAKLLFDTYKINDGINISIDKHIPVAAGLAGGSTDAAGVIVGINELYGLNMSSEEMMEIGLRLGADVPYCLTGGTALAEGIGEMITQLTPVKETWCVIAKPPVSISTAEVYKNLRLDEIARHPDTNKLLSFIKSGDIESLAQGMINVLETVTMKKYPVIFEIKNIMLEFHALGSLMSGSGTSVFGLFKDKAAAEQCYNRLRDYLKEVYLVKTFNEGVQIL